MEVMQSCAEVDVEAKAVDHQKLRREIIDELVSTLELCLACNGKLSWEAEQQAEIVCRQAKEQGIAPNSICTTNILTQREKELLVLAAQGKTREQIARMLSIKGDTVKKHFNKILRTLHASNKTQAVSIATALGAITLCLEDVQSIPDDNNIFPIETHSRRRFYPKGEYISRNSNDMRFIQTNESLIQR